MSIRIIQFLNQIENASVRGKRGILFCYMSNDVLIIADILKQNNRIESYEVVKAKTKKGHNVNYLSVKLLYWIDDKNQKHSFFKKVEFISKPGRVLTVRANKIFPIFNGNGFSIIRTDKGIMDGFQAKKLNIGGEFIAICY